MDANTAQTILVLYVIFNGIRVFSYFPQILTITKQKTDVSAISLLTWSIWTCSNFISGLYTTVITPDMWLAIISFINSACCLAVISCVLYKRKKYAIKSSVGDLDVNLLPQVALSTLQKDGNVLPQAALATLQK